MAATALRCPVTAQRRALPRSAVYQTANATASQTLAENSATNAHLATTNTRIACVSQVELYWLDF